MIGKRRIGHFRPQIHSLPVESQSMNMNSSSRRKRLLSAGHSPLASLLLLTIIFVVLGIFFNFLPSKVSIISQPKASSIILGCPHGIEQKWHGGHPAQDRPGACWCGGDDYCMCTPSVAIDIVLYSKTETKDRYDVWVVRRADTGQLATIGG
jgi:hypothetical protein